MSEPAPSSPSAANDKSAAVASGYPHAIAAALISAAVVWLALVVVGRRENPVYLVDMSEITLVLVAGVLALAGLAGMLILRDAATAALAALTIGLLIAGWAAILSIGLVLLLAAVIPGWVLVNRWSKGDGRAALSGAGIAAGLLVLVWLTLQPPLVRCNEDGATVSIPGGFGTVSGESHAEDGVETGVARFDGQGFEYECRNGELARFQPFQTSE